MKVLFIYPSWTGEYGLMSHFAKRAGVFPPLNLALLAAIAERAGHEAVIIDAEVNCMRISEVVQRAQEIKPDIIAMTGKSPFFHLSRQTAAALKQVNPEIPIVIGGPHITIMEKKAFFSEFDYAFIGECEDTWPEFLNRLEKGKDISDIKGIIYRRKDEAVYTGQHVYKRELDKLPFPARHLLPMDKYYLGTLQGRKNFTSIQSIRGCPWQCIFCASAALNTTSIGMRSAELVVQEMKHVVEVYGINHFMFVDDVLTLYPKHITEICDRIIASNLKVTFEGSTRSNLITEDLVIKMKEAGLTRLSFGLETVDTEMRKTMKKKVPLEHYTKANEILGKHDVEALNSVMLGLPGETPETIRKTLSFLRNDRHVKQANFAIAVPYPGTEFHEIAKRGDQGVQLMTEDFSQYRRYGNAVTNVNGMTQQDLIDFQNEGFVSIYSAPWRWKPMLRKHGLIGGILMLLRVFRLTVKMTFGKSLSKENEKRKNSPNIQSKPITMISSENVSNPSLKTLKKVSPAVESESNQKENQTVGSCSG